MPRRVAGGEPGTQETRGQGGEGGNHSQVWCARELGTCQVPLQAPRGRDVLCAALSPSRLSLHPKDDLGQLCPCAGGGEMPSIPWCRAGAQGAGRATGIAAPFSVSVAPR